MTFFLLWPINLTKVGSSDNYISFLVIKPTIFYLYCFFVLVKGINTLSIGMDVKLTMKFNIYKKKDCVNHWNFMSFWFQVVEYEVSKSRA